MTLACNRARSDDSASGLGVRDHGIFSDLDAQVRVALPASLEPARVSFVIDRARRQLLLYSDSWPVKVYPLAGDVTLEASGQRIQLRGPDAAELAPLMADTPIYTFEERVEFASRRRGT